MASAGDLLRRGGACSAREDQIDVLTLFTNVASKHEIAEDGVIDVHDLDLDASYVGVVVAQGMAPA